MRPAWLALLALAAQPLTADDTTPYAPPACLPDDAAYARIPAGEFFAGSSEYERSLALEATAAGGLELDPAWLDHEEDFGPAETAAFEIARAPVTQAEYMAFVRWSGHRAPGMTEEDWEEQGFTAHPFATVGAYVWRGTRHPTDLGSHPVVLVSREDAEAYAAWLSARTGCQFRLPTAKEWERASRGEEGHHYAWGDEWDGTLLNSGNAVGGTTPVGSYIGGASPYSLVDTTGNVFEWTADQTPTGQAILKGCSWDDLPAFCRPAYWHPRPPQTRHILIGFRLVRQLPALPDDAPGEPLGDPPDPNPG